MLLTAPKLLLVEDHYATREAMLFILRSEGFHVFACDSGEEALPLLDQHQFALALLDVRLTGIGGEQLAEQLKRRQPKCHLMLASAYGDAADVELPEGAVFFAKPIHLQPFLNYLSEWCRNAGAQPVRSNEDPSRVS